MARKPKETTITAYKAFNPDFSCRGFQYEVGKTYEVEGNVRACENGFHSCENPWDTLRYYDLVNSDGSLARFASVTVSGKIDRESDKICSGRITVEDELTLPAFIEAGIKWIIDATKGAKDKLADSGYDARIGSSGDYARIGSSGYGARIVTEGQNAVIASAGVDTAASGKDGTWISLAEFRDGKCIGFATGCIGQDGLKADTAYRAKDGKLVEVSA